MVFSRLRWPEELHELPFVIRSDALYQLFLELLVRRVRLLRGMLHVIQA